MNRSDRRVTVGRETTVFDDVFRIRAADVSIERSDGTLCGPHRRLCLDRGDSAAAVLHDRDAKATVLVRQFRYPTHAKGPGWVDELVAGMIEPGETAEDTLAREVREETGLVPRDLHPVATVYLSPGGSSERVFLYAAQVDIAARPGTEWGDPKAGELTERIALPLDDAFGRLDRGEVIDAKTMIGLQWLRMNIR